MPEIKTGGVKMIEVDGKYRVWTKRVGSGTSKMLTLHGGPGCTHEYFECFEETVTAAADLTKIVDKIDRLVSDEVC